MKKDIESLSHTKWKCKYHTVGRNKKQIEEYIRNQLREDYVATQLTVFEEVDPFTGQKNCKK